MTRSRARAWWRAVALLLLCGPGFASRVGATQATDPIAARAAEGAAAMRAGRFDAAATIYAELTTARPDDAGLLMNLGMARYMAGHPDQALGPLQKSARLNPSLAPASLFLGASLLDLGRAREAILPLQRAVTAMPQNADAMEMLARAYLGHVAVREIRAALPYTGGEPARAIRRPGMAWLEATRGSAEAALDALQQQAPDSPLLELVVADVAVSQEKYPAALAIYRRVMEGTPPVGGLHEAVAEIYERAGKPEWAAQERRAVKPRSGRRVRPRASRSATFSPAGFESRSRPACSRRRRAAATGRFARRTGWRPRRWPDSRRCRRPSSSI